MEDILMKLDELTTSIVMNFELVIPVHKTLSNINEVRENINEYVVEFDNDELIATKKKNNYKISVKVDSVNKRIYTDTSGVKYEADDKKVRYPKHFVKKKVFSVVDNSSTSYTYNREYRIFNNKNNTKIDAEVSRNYNFYEDGRFMGSNYEKEKKVVIKDNSNSTINEFSDVTNSNVYVLATGDMLERNDVNGSVSFYLVSSSNDKDEFFRKKLNEKQYEELISLERAPYVVANNDIVYASRKTNYGSM